MTGTGLLAVIDMLGATIQQLRDELERSNAENARLREQLARPAQSDETDA